MAKIFLLEDDSSLVQQAKQALTGRGYQFEQIDLLQAYVKDRLTTLQYWQGLGITPKDLVVLDINFKQKGVNYNGLEVLEFIDSAKTQRQLLGLEKVLMATSMKDQLNSFDVRGTRTQPPVLSVYGMEKATNAKHEVTGIYATDLCDKVARIYSGQETPLNLETP